MEFEITSIDGMSVIVRYKNPYGPIATGKKTVEETRATSRVATGKVDSQGKPVFETMFLDNPNPNDDFDLAINIDFDGDGQPDDAETIKKRLAEYGARVVADMAERYKLAQTANLGELEKLVGVSLKVEDHASVEQALPAADAPPSSLFDARDLSLARTKALQSREV